MAEEICRSAHQREKKEREIAGFTEKLLPAKRKFYYITILFYACVYLNLFLLILIFLLWGGGWGMGAEDIRRNALLVLLCLNIIV